MAATNEAGHARDQGVVVVEEKVDKRSKVTVGLSLQPCHHFQTQKP